MPHTHPQILTKNLMAKKKHGLTGITFATPHKYTKITITYSLSEDAQKDKKKITFYSPHIQSMSHRIICPHVLQSHIQSMSHRFICPHFYSLIYNLCHHALYVLVLCRKTFLCREPFMAPKIKVWRFFLCTFSVYIRVVSHSWRQK